MASYDFVLQSGWLDFSKLTLCSLVDSYLIVHSKLYKHFLCYFFLFFNFVFNHLILIYASQTCPSFIILYVHSNLRSQFISKKRGAKFELDVDAVGVYFNIDVLTTPSYVILDGLKQSV